MAEGRGAFHGLLERGTAARILSGDLGMYKGVMYEPSLPPALLPPGYCPPSFCRISTRRIFPLIVFGSSSTNSIMRGIL